MWIRRMTGRSMERRAEGETRELGFYIERVIMNGH